MGHRLDRSRRKPRELCLQSRLSLFEKRCERLGPPPGRLGDLTLTQPLKRDPRLLEPDDGKIGQRFFPGVVLDRIPWGKIDCFAVGVDRLGQIALGMVEISQSEPGMERARLTADQYFEILLCVLMSPVPIMGFGTTVEGFDRFDRLA